jgi:hypothetical protein
MNTVMRTIGGVIGGQGGAAILSDPSRIPEVLYLLGLGGRGSPPPVRDRERSSRPGSTRSPRASGAWPSSQPTA